MGCQQCYWSGNWILWSLCGCASLARSARTMWGGQDEWIHCQHNGPSNQAPQHTAKGTPRLGDLTAAVEHHRVKCPETQRCVLTREMLERNLTTARKSLPKAALPDNSVRYRYMCDKLSPYGASNVLSLLFNWILVWKNKRKILKYSLLIIFNAMYFIALPGIQCFQNFTFTEWSRQSNYFAMLFLKGNIYSLGK